MVTFAERSFPLPTAAGAAGAPVTMLPVAAAAVLGAGAVAANPSAGIGAGAAGGHHGGGSGPELPPVVDLSICMSTRPAALPAKPRAEASSRSAVAAVVQVK